MSRSKALAKVLLVLTVLGCDQAARPRGTVPDQGPPPPPSDAGPPGLVYDARVAPSDDGPAAPALPDAAVATAADAPVAAPADALPPVSGDFPLASAMAAKPELWAMSGGHVEGPSYRD